MITAFFKRFDIALVFISSFLLKVYYAFLMPERFLHDATGAINFGKSCFTSGNLLMFIRENSIHCKSFVGPLLWFLAYQNLGIRGLKFINLASFVLLFLIQYFIGKKIYKRTTVVVALFLFAFYVGTNISIAIGEPDDNISAIIFSSAILIFIHKESIFLPSLLMGIAFLFKFSIGIFYLGFVLYLLISRGWKMCFLSAVGMFVPFLCINLIDNFNTLHALFISFAIQKGYSTWGAVYFKLFSTGLLISFLASLLTALKGKIKYNLLFFFPFLIYVVYVFVFRDAFSMPYIMMQVLIFSSFLVAEYLLKFNHFEKFIPKKYLMPIILISYLAITVSITHYDFYNSLFPISRR